MQSDVKAKSKTHDAFRDGEAKKRREGVTWADFKEIIRLSPVRADQGGVVSVAEKQLAFCF